MILLECAAVVDSAVDTLLTIGVSIPEVWDIFAGRTTVDNG